ncbi:hypothetical protein [Streptomyces sp. NPDC091383]|uniref:hypothetical protein n=1 Tax=Streptomyces sp. NPDC091383 TaxID=3365996 RepID=UPI0038159BF1
MRYVSVAAATAPVDRGEGTGDVQEPVHLGAADAELRVAVRLPAAVPEGEPDAGGVRVADPGGEHRHGAPDVVHRLPQPGRHLPGAGRGERRPCWFGDVLLVLVVLAHDSVVLRAGERDQGVQKHRRASSASQPHSLTVHRVYLGKRPVNLTDLTA